MTQIKAAAEAKLADFEREKMMIELDIKEIIARHKTEVTERMAWSSKVTLSCHIDPFMRYPPLDERAIDYNGEQTEPKELRE